eukprot:XP_019078057.1 PREDICTED: uncharacterized protein LOC109123274 [Vitis vinifera]
MAYAYAAITTLEVPNQNSNEQQKFCFTPEEFHKLMALANSVQPNSSDQNNVQLAVNLVSISHFSEVYMELPIGLAVQGEQKVCRLLKSLYGLKQASKQWYAKLSQAILSYGFVQVYVDDVLLASDSILEIERLETFLDAKFTIKDLGPLKYFLGLEVARSKTVSAIHFPLRPLFLGVFHQFQILLILNTSDIQHSEGVKKHVDLDGFGATCHMF